MKRSQLKDLIQEAVIELLPDLIDILTENINESIKKSMIIENMDSESRTRYHIDKSMIRQHVDGAIKNRGYDEIPGEPIAERRSSNIPKPNNPIEVINGEKFVSGKGILEWYNKTGPANLQPEFKHSEDEIGKFMKDRFGVK